MKRVILMLVIFTMVWTSISMATAYGKFVAINGQVLTQQQIAALEMQLGVSITPGAYLVDVQSGCWMNTTTGQRGCGVGGNGGGQYNSRYGSGERNGNGDWSHYSNAAGGGVGGTGDGCVYAFGWSNC